MSVTEPPQPNVPTGSPDVPVSATRVGLFRRESLEYRQMLWLGQPAVKLGIPAKVLSLVALVMVAAALALVTFGSYARRVDLHGVMLPAAGLIEVSAPAAGWVQSAKVQDGQAVADGTPLYVINTDTANSNGSTQQQIQQALASQRAILVAEMARKLQLRNERNANLQRKIQNLQAQIQQTDAEISMKADFVQAATQNYVDFSRFLQRGLGTLHEKIAQQQNWMHAKAEVESLKGSALRLRAELNESQFQAATSDLETDNEIDAMRTKIAELDKEVANSETKHSIEVLAPGAGTVTAIASHPGQTVATGTRMLTIVPSADKMQAQLLAPSTSIGFIRPGERVLLRYSAFPYQKFGEHTGTVTEVSHAALLPQELKTLVPTLPVADQSKTFYRVIVTPDRQDVMVYGHAAPLQASMQVDASVLLERRPIYQWIVEPLFDLSGA